MEVAVPARPSRSNNHSLKRRVAEKQQVAAVASFDDVDDKANTAAVVSMEAKADQSTGAAALVSEKTTAVEEVSHETRMQPVAGDMASDTTSKQSVTIEEAPVTINVAPVPARRTRRNATAEDTTITASANDDATSTADKKAKDELTVGDLVCAQDFTFPGRW